MFDSDEPDWFSDPAYAESLTGGDRVRVLLSMSPVARPADELGRIDPDSLTAGERIDLVALITEQRNWLDAIEARALASIDAADHSKLQLAHDAVSLVMKVPPRTAQNKLRLSRTLLRQLPQTFALLSRGEISGRHAQVIAESAWRLDPDVVASFEARVAARAGQQTVSQVQRSARRAELAVDPATAEARRQRALLDRKVCFQPLDDGMSQLSVFLPASEGQAIFTRLTAAAQLLPATDPRNVDAQRADLLVDAVLSGLPHDALPELQGRRPSIQVLVSATTLLGLDDEPADVSGYGAITAEAARELAGDPSGTWRRLLTDPNTGELLDISEGHYRPSQRLRDFVSARDGVCSFPTCNQPGYRCEYEHIVPYSQGGQTCRCNGALACRRHNLCKVNTGWGYTLNEDGSFTWTTDTGHRYTSHPPERWSRPPDGMRPSDGMRPPDRIEAAARPRVTDADLWAAHDRAYARLVARLAEELDGARAAGDPARIRTVKSAISDAERQRARELAHRIDRSVPPF